MIKFLMSDGGFVVGMILFLIIVIGVLNLMHSIQNWRKRK